jgi:hypothetical protein
MDEAKTIRMVSPVVGAIGTMPRYPFRELGMGDKLIVPRARADRENMVRAVRRETKRRPEVLYSVTALNDEPESDWVVERVR